MADLFRLYGGGEKVWSTCIIEFVLAPTRIRYVGDHYYKGKLILGSCKIFTKFSHVGMATEEIEHVLCDVSKISGFHPLKRSKPPKRIGLSVVTQDCVSTKGLILYFAEDIKELLAFTEIITHPKSGGC